MDFQILPKMRENENLNGKKSKKQIDKIALFVLICKYFKAFFDEKES